MSQALPVLSENEPLNLIQILPTQHFTEPPPRYNEASLIKKLEELEIGRPSTYAPILSTIVERFYVEKLERKFIPTSLGFTVCEFLLEYFPDVLEPVFTGGVESRAFHLVKFLEKRHKVEVVKRTGIYSFNSLAAVIHRVLFFLRQLVKIIFVDKTFENGGIKRSQNDGKARRGDVYAF